jgi:hypothetical protein
MIEGMTVKLLSVSAKKKLPKTKPARIYTSNER